MLSRRRATSASRAAGKERLFDDLFQGLAVGMNASNVNNKNAVLANLYRNKAGIPTATVPTDSGRVIN